MARAEGDAWLRAEHNLLAFGPPGIGKTHAASGLGHELVRRGYRVPFIRTTDLVQRRQALSLTQEIAKLDRFDLLILDDLSYVRKDQAETSALFELISARYERRSIMITANQPFSGWDAVFPDKSMTVAAIDRLVHHAIILEMNVEIYRRRMALASATSLRDITDESDSTGAVEPGKPTSNNPATSTSDIALDLEDDIGAPSSRHRGLVTNDVADPSSAMSRATVAVGMIGNERPHRRTARFQNPLRVQPARQPGQRQPGAEVGQTLPRKRRRSAKQIEKPPLCRRDIILQPPRCCVSR